MNSFAISKFRQQDQRRNMSYVLRVKTVPRSLTWKRLFVRTQRQQNEYMYARMFELVFCLTVWFVSGESGHFQFATNYSNCSVITRGRQQ